MECSRIMVTGISDEMAVDSIQLNGFEVFLSAPTFTAYVEDMPSNEEFRELRDELESSWFLYWHEGKAYGLPRTVRPTVEFGAPIRLHCQDNLRFLAARIVSALPYSLPDNLRVFRRRPFTFLAGKDLVQLVAEKIGNVNPLISGFKIRPRYELDAKIVETTADPFIGIFLEVRMRWEVEASLFDLHDAGIDLCGLYAVLRNPEPGQRRLVGRIARLSGDDIELSDSFEGIRTISAEEVTLEGSRASFARCLKKLLGFRYDTFEEGRDAEEAKYYTGPALDGILTRAQSFLAKYSPLELGGGLTCTINQRIVAKNTAEYRSVVTVPPVEYCFDPARTKRSEYAWMGIDRYGPYSRDTFPKQSPRILVLFPDTIQGQVERFLRQFRDGISLDNSKYPSGFAKTYGLVNPEFVLRKIPWLASGRRDNPALAYRKTTEEFLAEHVDSYPDVAIVALLDEHTNLPDAENPYLITKALLLTAGIPVQEIKLSTLSQKSYSLQYTMQNLSLQIYSKMNGTPWTVDHDLTINDELVIGMGTCELSGSRFEQKQRFIGITTVFRGDGNYLLSNVSRECRYEQYPGVLRQSTLEILSLIKERNGWRPGDTVRIVFHVYKPLKNIEVADIMAECIETLCGEQNVEFAFLTVSHDHPFTILDTTQHGVPVKYGSTTMKGIYTPERGTVVQLGSFTRLLGVNSPKLIKRANAPLPTPLLVHLHHQSTFRDLQYLTTQVLKFTSLSWRSTLPAAKPVSIYYSELIAGLLARLRVVPDWSPLMLNIKLRASRWFL